MDLNTIVLGALNLVLGAFGAVLWGNYKMVLGMAQNVSKELSDYKLHVAERYATADEVKSLVSEINASFEKYGNKIDAALLRIESKLDTKQDRRRDDN